MNDAQTRVAVSKLMGKNRYAVAVRITGYYNIEVEAHTMQEADAIAVNHEYTWDDLSYQGEVEVDEIERMDDDRAD